MWQVVQVRGCKETAEYGIDVLMVHRIEHQVGDNFESFPILIESYLVMIQLTQPDMTWHCKLVS